MTLRIFKTSVTVEFHFVAVITLMLVLFPESLVGICFLMCVLHESGHLLAMLCFGKKVENLTLGYFGMRILTDKRFLPRSREAAIASAGPLVNIILGGAFYFFGQNDIATVNFSLGIFNLLPVKMLDGGHIISAFFPDGKAVKVISLLTCFILVIVGLLVAIKTKENFTILIVSLYILTGTATDLQR